MLNIFFYNFLIEISSPQVITWFQNRRAKYKRDLEELKKDMITNKIKSEVNERLLSAGVHNIFHHWLVAHKMWVDF